MPEMNPMRQFMAGAPPALPRRPNAALLLQVRALGSI
jgi:hypothetical protein